MTDTDKHYSSGENPEKADEVVHCGPFGRVTSRPDDAGHRSSADSPDQAIIGGAGPDLAGGAGKVATSESVRVVQFGLSVGYHREDPDVPERAAGVPR